MDEKLSVLLEAYDRLMAQFVKDFDGEYQVRIKLDEGFLRTCRERIIRGHEQYGDDYKYKDCIKEREFELFDYINYTILDAIQKEITPEK